MKDTPETRDRLAQLINKGAEAYDLLKRLDPKFEKVQDRYRNDLVSAVRAKAEKEQIVMIACQITALDDVYDAIHEDTVTGDRALQDASLLEENSGKH